MQIKNLKDQELLKQTQEAVACERRATMAVLLYIGEVEARMLFAVNHSSLFDWMTKELKYSEGQAQRRIDGARLLRQLPALAVKLSTGALNLSQLSLVQSYLRREKKRGKQFTPEEKLTLLQEIEGKPAREVEKLLKEKSGLKTVKGIQLHPTEEELEILKQVRALWAHKLQNGTWTEVCVEAAKFVLTQIDPLQKAPATSPDVGGETRNRHIPAGLRRATWQRDHGQCSYVGPDGKRCTSKYALEIDHCQPYALGGEHTPENLRLLCRTHNRCLAFRHFGRAKMEQHGPSL